jgi:hypothetical protein
MVEFTTKQAGNERNFVEADAAFLPRRRIDFNAHDTTREFEIVDFKFQVADDGANQSGHGIGYG